MPTRKIDDPKEAPEHWRQRVCQHLEHNPPNMMVYQPGTYEHECPSCGRKIVFTVDPTLCCGMSLGGRRI